MIDPPRPASIMAGTTARTSSKYPVRLTSSVSCHWASESSHVSAAAEKIPWLPTTMSMWPNSGHGLGADPLQRSAVAHIGLVRHDPAVEILHQPHRLLQVLGRRHGIGDRVDLRADVQGDDVGALFGQPHRVGTALPPCRPGDDRDFALEPPA